MAVAKNRDMMDSHIGVIDYRNILRIDWVLLSLTLALAVIGLFTLYSAGQSSAADFPYWAKQSIWLLGGGVLAALIVCVDYRFLVSLAPIFYCIVIGLLVWVEFHGHAAGGGQRWMWVGPFRLQPSELSKPVLILSLTWYLMHIEKRITRLFFFLLAFAIAAVPGVLILIEPSLGTAASLAPIIFAMLYVAGCKRRHLVLVLIAGAACAAVGWDHLEDYQKQRFISFADPNADPTGSGLHIIQTKITVGSGQMWGKGFTEGTQTHLSYLPQHHTDFIFALLAEEEGFVGAVVVIGLFALLLLRGLSIARDCPDMSGKLIVSGCVAILAFHVFLNVAITIGIMPVTGIPLPFMSYGGSFYMTTMICIGLMLNAHIKRGIYFA
jgi:rod shape determining protein RodA